MGAGIPGHRFFCTTTISRLFPVNKGSVHGVVQPISCFSSYLLCYSNENYSRTSRRWHVGHSHQDYGNDGDKVFRLGFAADVALATGKAVTGYLSGSAAIIADAAHSVSDIALSGVALWSFRVAKAPKDKEHPYGHGKFETLGALGISCMLLGTAGGIAWHAIDVLQGTLFSTPDAVGQLWDHAHVHVHGHNGHHHNIDMEHPVLALSMTVISISVKEGLYQFTKRVGERVGSGLMKANAWHHRSDAVSSVVALVGVGGSILGVRFLDPLAGLLVAGMILRAGIATGYQSVLELVDTGISQHTLHCIKETVLRTDGIMGCKQLRGRRAGSSLHLDAHIEVDPSLSVSSAHDIAENVRRRIEVAHSGVVETFIHIDPASSEHLVVTDKRKDFVELQNGRINQNLEQGDAEAILSEILSSNFKMTVEHVTRHTVEGKPVIQVHVSMAENILIRDAMLMAKEAEKEIMKSAHNINGISILLRLGDPLSQFLSRSNSS